MDTQNTSRQLRYLEEVRTPLHRAGFETLPVEGEQLPVLWNGAPLCRITGKGSVFYRREDVDTPQAEDALYRVEDIAAKTLEYMTAMEAAPQLKASGLDGDYRILADFGGTVLAGSPSKYGVQFVTWDWDYDRTGAVHGHYFMENYDGAKQDFATRSGLIQKEQLFSPEQLTEIYRCCTDSVNEHFFELTDKQVELIHSVQQQIEICVPDLDKRVRQQEEALERASRQRTHPQQLSLQCRRCALQNPDTPWLTGLSALADTPEGDSLTRRRRKTVRIRRFEKKVALVKVKKALIPHFSKLQRQSAALHAEVIRKLLPGERNVKFIAAPALRLGGKIGHELCPRRALAHVGEFFVEPQVLLRQLAQQVADDPAMVGAGGGAHAQNAPYV